MYRREFSREKEIQALEDKLNNLLWELEIVQRHVFPLSEGRDTSWESLSNLLRIEKIPGEQSDLIVFRALNDYASGGMLVFEDMPTDQELEETTAAAAMLEPGQLTDFLFSITQSSHSGTFFSLNRL